jgi:hypothetical protein
MSVPPRAVIIGFGSVQFATESRSIGYVSVLLILQFLNDGFYGRRLVMLSPGDKVKFPEKGGDNQRNLLLG